VTYNYFPYNFRKIDHQYFLVSNISGNFFLCKKETLDKIIHKKIDNNLEKYLLQKGFLFKEQGDFNWNNNKFKLVKRKMLPEKIGYYMIVPTLRCNINCSYCQVSRVDQNTNGYDWDDNTLDHFFKFVSKYSDKNIKIEFQGGEPTLRVDIIKKVIQWADKNKYKAEFAICTNLLNINQEFEEIIARDDVHLSTSIDGSYEIQKNQRTKSDDLAKNFFKNFEYVSNKYGLDKISALPTFYDFDQVVPTIDFYESLGLKTIYLRPVNFQGFARKKHPISKNLTEEWGKIYNKALDYIFQKNYNKKNNFMMEFSFLTNLRRIFQPGSNGHVDLRNPNFASRDNFIVDYNGVLFPSDEARMISRIGLVDLSLGNIFDGLDSEKISNYNWNQISDVNSDCIHCSYQPYCGIDTVDDLSRYNRIDLPKIKTNFCQNNLRKFDDIFSRILSNKPENILNITGHLTGIFSTIPPFSDIIYD